MSEQPQHIGLAVTATIAGEQYGLDWMSSLTVLQPGTNTFVDLPGPRAHFDSQVQLTPLGEWHPGWWLFWVRLRDAIGTSLGGQRPALVYVGEVSDAPSDVVHFPYEYQASNAYGTTRPVSDVATVTLRRAS